MLSPEPQNSNRITELSQSVEELIVVVGGKSSRRDTERVDTKINNIVNGSTALASLLTTGTFSAGASTLASLLTTGTLSAGASTLASLLTTGTLSAGASTLASLLTTGTLSAGDSTVASLLTTGTLSAGILNATAGFITVATTGTVISGTVTVREPFQGSSYKKVVVHLAAATTNNALYNFNSAFTSSPSVTVGNKSDGSPNTDMTSVLSSSTVGLDKIALTNTNSSTGYLFIEGF